MNHASLEDKLNAIDNPARMFRNIDMEWHSYVFPPEYTNWIEEQRAVKESVAVVDQSYHMEILHIEGSEAVDLLEYLGTNSLESFRTDDPPQATNLLLCNPDGYFIGDNILFYLDENEFTFVGNEIPNNWVRYHAQTMDYDAHAEVLYHHDDDQNPPDFRFQVQGPEAMTVLETVVDGSLPEIPFFQMDTIEIDGVEVNALAHGMAAMPGLEIFGPYQHHDRVLEKILDAGEKYDIRQLGTKAYKTGKIGSGWFVFTVPAIYEHEDLKDYREWLGPDSMEATLSIGGSFDSDDITDYYMTPMERDQAKLIDFDHRFVGREALEEMVENQQREKVTLVWDAEDVLDVFRSLFGDGPMHKFIDLPDVANKWSVMHYDTILKDGEVVGVSKYPGYLAYQREMLSLATIDVEYSEPGTEVSFLWGDTSEKRKVERHEPVEIRATVAPSPYVEGGRRRM